MTDAIWQPSEEQIIHSQMWAFMQFVNQLQPANFKTYAELYDWSIQYPEQFWPALSKFFGVIYAKNYDEVLANPQKMPGAKWFVGARLNFAENLLRLRDCDDKPAVVFRNEKGERRTLSCNQLYQAVAKFAAGLRAAGVTVNDRVAGFMPNMPEAIIAMLATTSIGAIWSSCSPDFGTQGVYDRFNQIQPKILVTTDGYYYNGKTFDSLKKMTELVAQTSSIEKTVVVPYISQSPDFSTLNNAVLYEHFIVKNAEEITFAQLPFDHPIFILYSSGTTGAPKCIVHGAGGVLLQLLKELNLHTDLSKKDTFFYFTTCGWMMWNYLVSGLATGATLVLYDGSPLFPKPRSLFDLIDEEKITVFGTSAKYISSVEKAHVKPIETHNLSSLRTILSTGSPLLPMNYDYVYTQVKKDVCLSSISGGTDIVSCFAVGNPILPVYRGELQCRGLGLKLDVYNEAGQSVRSEKGELVCTAPFPVMPIYFWNDENGEKYRQAYFNKFPNVWAHGDFAEITEHDGVIIYGRSDATLNPGGVRIGTAEIYRQVEKIDDVLESLVIGQDWRDDVRIILFVKLRDGITLTEALKDNIKTAIRRNASPHHVPAKIIQVADIPKTISGKIVELAVREIIHDRPVKNIDALANPGALDCFKNIAELLT